MSQLTQVRFTGVETPKRLQNAADLPRGIVRHTFDVKAKDIEAATLIQLDGPNPRTPNVRKKAVKELRESLLGADPSTVGAFHLAHAGVRGIVKAFRRIDETTYEATFEVGGERKAEDDGIANGLHTIAVIREAVKEGDIPDEQYINFTLVENVADRNLVPYIGRGLNTNLQVSEESIINLAGEFEPFKTAIAETTYANEIAWYENDSGEYDARDVFAVLHALNVKRFPNTSDSHPIESYEKQGACILAFKAELAKGKPTSYHSMIPLLKDALYLYDLIRSDAGERYRDRVMEGRPGRLAIMESRPDKDRRAKPDIWTFPFISGTVGKAEWKRGTYRLSKGATFAMLAAFRNFIEYDEKTGTMKWSGGFDTVKKAWGQLGGEMMVAAVDVSATQGYNPNAVGKNRPLWRQLHQIAEAYRLRLESDRLRREIERMRTRV